MSKLPGTQPPRQAMAPGIDSRARILAALVLIAAIVLTAPMDLAEFLVVIIFIGAVVALLDGSVIAALRRGLLVLPFAGAIALFAPLASLEAGSWAGVAAAYARGWPLILALLAKAYLSVLIAGALAATTPVPELLRGMQALGVSDIFLTLFTFLLRYRDLFRAQVAALHDAIASRAPRLRGWRRLMLYGSLGGNLLIRAYERGEQVYDAMLARGYAGTLPAATPLCWRAADSGFLAIGLVFAGALVIYR